MTMAPPDRLTARQLRGRLETSRCRLALLEHRTDDDAIAQRDVLLERIAVLEVALADELGPAGDADFDEAPAPEPRVLDHQQRASGERE